MSTLTHSNTHKHTYANIQFCLESNANIAFNRKILIHEIWQLVLSIRSDENSRLKISRCRSSNA